MQSNSGEMEMHAMRFFLAVLTVALGLAGTGVAVAADLSGNFSGGYGGGYRAEPLLIYSYEPGVVIRTYWAEPWRNHRYFPSNGHRPKMGRLENLSAVSRHLPEAQPFYRSWSTSDVSYVPEPPRHRVQPRFADPEQPLETPLK
jgi:hypothetical protein